MAAFNGFNSIDLLEFDIDLKIMHINEREQVQNLTPDDWRSWEIHATGEI